MLRVTGGWVPLHQIKFVHDDGTVMTIDGDTYQAEPAAIAALVPKRKSVIVRALAKTLRWEKSFRPLAALLVMTWRLI